VRETLAKLGGEIHVVSSPGQGTRFTMRLPLTTAVSHAVLFKVGGEVFALPKAHIAGTGVADQHSLSAGECEHNGAQLPLQSLASLIGVTEDPRDTRPYVVLDYAGKRTGLWCDKLVGPRQVVIKSLGAVLSHIPLFAGGTISGSGKVQLILDPAALIRLTHGLPPHRSSGLRAAIRRVLVVDDSRASREAATRILERAGYTVDVASDGEQAWTRLLSGDYHCLVTDVEMPELDGFALVERLLAHDTMPASQSSS